MRNSILLKTKRPLFIIMGLVTSFLSPVTSSYAYEAPYNIPAFRDVLKKSKLQFPQQMQRDFGQLKGVAKANFYLKDGRYMTFKSRKRNKKTVIRSELRFGPNGWKVNSKRSKLLKAEFALDKPRSIEQITILQIHAVNPSYPPLRIVWLKRHKSRDDHLWAIVRPSPYHKKIHYIDLGKRPKNRFTRVSVSVKNNYMKIWLNKRLRTTQSLKQWKGTVNYYKAGIYLSGKKDVGMATVSFRLLEHKI